MTAGVPDNIPDWALEVARGGGVHSIPANLSQWNALSEEVRRQLSGQLLESIVSQIVVAVQGLFIPGNFGTALQQLSDWASRLPFISDLVEAFTGVEDGDYGDLGSWVNNLKQGLMSLFQVPSISLPTPEEFFNGLLHWNFAPIRIPPISIGQIVEPTNLLPDSGFATLPGGDAGTWYHRSDVGHTSPGSAWIDADGEPHELLTTPIAVAAGQYFLPTIWVAWDEATATADAFELVFIKIDSGGYRVGEYVAATATPSGTAGFAELTPESSYQIPAGVAQIALAVRVTAGFTAGSLGVDDLNCVPTGKLQMGWTENLVTRWENTAALFGIVDTDLDGDVDFQDVWNTLHGLVPPAVNLAIDEFGTTVQGFLDLLAGAFDPVLRLLGLSPPSGVSANAAIQKAVGLADIAQHAYSTTILGANEAGDTQANEDDGVEIVDLNVFSGNDADILNPLDWVSSQIATPGVDDMVVRTEGGLPVMGIRSGLGYNTAGAGRYYYATWVDTFSTTAGFGQLVEMVLGFKGAGDRDTIILFHSNSTFTDGAYLRANTYLLSFGHYSASGGVYTFDSPIGTWPEGLSTGQRVGCYNSPQNPTVYNLTIGGKIVLQVTDTGSTIALDSSHIYARVLTERLPYTYTPPGWPWPNIGPTDGFRPAQVLFADYDPPAILTTGVQVSRHNTSPATRSGGWSEWSGVIDTIDGSSRDVVWASDELTVSKEGWYLCSTKAASITSDACGVFRNGSLAGAGGQCMQVYCYPGDVLAPATNSATGIVGSSDGFTTYFHVVRTGA